MKTIERFFTGISVACVTLISVGAASAATITGVTSFLTFGNEMNGMEVTVNFQGGATSTALFNATVGNSGAASAGGWSLTQPGRTDTNPWIFSNNTGSVISSLFINAIPGKTVFDVLRDSPSTPNSGGGIPFTFVSGVSPSSVEYDNIVNVSGSAPVGDLYADMTLFWDNGFSSGSSLSFLADTDSATAVTDQTNNTKPVPVPGVVAGIVLAAGFFSSKEINKRKTQLRKTEV